MQLAHLRGNGNFLQNTVNAVAHAEVVRQRFDVDVGGALAQGFADHLVDEFFHRGFLGLVLVDDIHLRGPHLVEFLVGRAPFEQFLESLCADAVDLTQRGENSFACVDLVAHALRNGLGHRLPREHVERVVSQQRDIVVIGGDRQELVAKGDACGQLAP